MVFISNRKLHFSVYSGQHQVLTTFLLEELYKSYISLIARKFSKPDDGRYRPKRVVLYC